VSVQQDIAALETGIIGVVERYDSDLCMQASHEVDDGCSQLRLTTAVVRDGTFVANIIGWQQ